MDFSKLRVPGVYPVPLVPKLSSQDDTKYFDDFTNPKDLAIYGEIMKREGENKKLVTKDVQGVNSAFVGFTFKHK
jgi:cell cycle protein kinase DBF2